MTGWCLWTTHDGPTPPKQRYISVKTKARCRFRQSSRSASSFTWTTISISIVFSFSIVYPPLLRFLTRVYLFTHALSRCLDRPTNKMEPFRVEGKEWTEERTDKFWGSEKYWEESVKRTIVHTREKNDLQYQLCNRFVWCCDAWHAAKSMDYRADETWRADFACHRDHNSFFFSREKMTNTRLKVEYIHRSSPHHLHSLIIITLMKITRC